MICITIINKGECDITPLLELNHYLATDSYCLPKMAYEKVNKYPIKITNEHKKYKKQCSIKSALSAKIELTAFLNKIWGKENVLNFLYDYFLSNQLAFNLTAEFPQIS